MSESEYLTINEFCVLFNISRTTYYKLKQRREGPPESRIGGHARISREKALEWAEGREV